MISSASDYEAVRSGLDGELDYCRKSSWDVQKTILALSAIESAASVCGEITLSPLLCSELCSIRAYSAAFCPTLPAVGS